MSILVFNGYYFGGFVCDNISILVKDLSGETMAKLNISEK